eukprot:g14953.t1
MAAMKRLAQLALLAAIATNTAVATELELTGPSGEEYVFQLSGDGGGIVMTESETVTVVEGSITTITKEGTVYNIDYDENNEPEATEVEGRRTQQVGLANRRLLSCEQSCQSDANRICGALEFGCGYGTLQTLLGTMCDDLDDLCNTAGIVFGCSRACAPSCATDADCTEPDHICCPSMNICEVPDITGLCRNPTPPPTPGPPTPAPTPAPTDAPTPAPTDAPTPAPTDAPTPAPTDAPTPAPTDAPTLAPTDAPTPAPTDAPTPAPTDAPTVTPAPTDAPTPAPTDAPTPAPTDAPTPAPTDAPTLAPTDAPTPAPTPEAVCMAGVPGILYKGEVCCPNSCGTCAGNGCSDRDGGDDFTGGEACCKSGVKSLGRICSATVGAPCIVSDETPAPTPAPVEEVCMAGVPGILYKDEICCPSSCGTCAGNGCSDRDGGDDFTGGEACCKSGVESLGRICSATVGAPCVVSDDPPAPTPAPVDEVCMAGVPGILYKGEVCCPSSCGSCAGNGCSDRDGGEYFTGGEACCKSGVESLGRICSDTVGAPCIVSDDDTDDEEEDEEEDDGDAMCSNGLAGYEAADVCCPVSCGRCGGSGCSKLGEGCCTRDVKDSGDLCSVTKAAPCNIDDETDHSEDEDDEMCTAGVAGILEKGYCCPTSCGSCGGSGCSGRDGGDSFSGSEACCLSGVKSLGRTCSDDVAAPCVVG